jgi:hypothetical protein
MGRRSLSAFFAFFALSVAVARGAAAQPVTPQAKAHAEAIFKEGMDLAKANKYKEALAKFEESRASVPNARATFQMARMEYALNDYTLALLHYRQALKEEGLPTQNRDEALKAIDELQAKVGVIMIDAPNGASVFVDGNAVADPKQPVEVAPGPHTVKATIGGETRTADANPQAGKVVSVKISFDAPTPPVTPPPPITGPTPPTTSPEQNFWTPGHIAGVGLAGLAVVGAGFAIGFGVVHESDVSRGKEIAKDPHACANPSSALCTEFNDKRDGASTATTLTIVSAAVAGAAAVGAAVLLWPRGGAVTARIAPSPNGAVVFGAF